MSWGELAQAFEDGDPAPAKWRQLLSGDRRPHDRLLLEAAHAHLDLRVFYPDLSMGSLILCRKPFDVESGLVKITPFSEDHCRVTMRPTGFRRDVTSLNEALDVAAACFRSLPDA
ncbi:DUF6193 family natural product biosynthesis protein [Streptomyces sp. CBMA152]|uniref:DUF6193 family natural product biosynthesis protein n=1 Tax=Streptomyces sp. CBMA152 TaxID=1896312 RepID=UPI0016604FC7|nr:DUF6193 family natural product biosynthesis protein [Streptomyces sp. CBMA152]MBD0741404.1 hypothetical protein [Streptomyces sp. CBMA152]